MGTDARFHSTAVSNERLRSRISDPLLSLWRPAMADDPAGGVGAALEQGSAPLGAKNLSSLPAEKFTPAEAAPEAAAAEPEPEPEAAASGDGGAEAAAAAAAKEDANKATIAKLSADEIEQYEDAFKLTARCLDSLSLPFTGTRTPSSSSTRTAADPSTPRLPPRPRPRPPRPSALLAPLLAASCAADFWRGLRRAPAHAATGARRHHDHARADSEQGGVSVSAAPGCHARGSSAARGPPQPGGSSQGAAARGQQPGAAC